APPNCSVGQNLRIVESEQPEIALSVQITVLVASSLHSISFPRARPTFLLLPDTIRRTAQPSSSGLLQRNRTYLPKRTCGIGSPDRMRTCSRIHDSGKFQRAA